MPTKNWRVQWHDRNITIKPLTYQNNQFTLHIDEQQLTAHVVASGAHSLLIQWKGKPVTLYFAREGQRIWIGIAGKSIEIETHPAAQKLGPEYTKQDWTADSKIEAPMPGKILKILVKEGQTVEANERLFIIEAMKMENEVRAPRAGTVRRIFFKENDLVSLGQPVLEMEFKN